MTKWWRQRLKIYNRVERQAVLFGLEANTWTKKGDKLESIRAENQVLLGRDKNGED